MDLNQIIAELYQLDSEMQGIEAMIEQAVDDEDFEQADALQQEMDKLKEGGAIKVKKLSVQKHNSNN